MCEITRHILITSSIKDLPYVLLKYLGCVLLYKIFVCNIKYGLIYMCCTLFGREQTCCTEHLAGLLKEWLMMWLWRFRAQFSSKCTLPTKVRKGERLKLVFIGILSGAVEMNPWPKWKWQILTAFWHTRSILGCKTWMLNRFLDNTKRHNTKLTST